MVRLNTILFLAALALPTGAWALEVDILEKHPGFDKLLAGADAAGLLTSGPQEIAVVIET